MATEVTTLSIPGADGLPVAVDLYPSSRAEGPLLVGLHGFKGFKTWGFFPWLATRLAGAGFTTALMNFSRCGIEGDDSTFSRLDLFEQDTWGRRLQDVRAVLDAATRGKLGGNPGRLGLFGHSMGGGVALLVASRDGRVRSLATLAGVAQPNRIPAEIVQAHLRAFGLVKVQNLRTGQELPVGREFFDELRVHPALADLRAAAARCTVPWLLVHGAQDEAVPLTDAHELLEAASCNAVGGDNTRLLVPDAGTHTFGATHPFRGPTPELEQLAAAVEAHFARTL